MIALKLIHMIKQNKADIKRETFLDHPTQDRASMNIKVAGANLAPWGFEHEGSVAVHFYKKPNTHDYIFITHLVQLDKVPEGQADVGLKELRRAMMGVYGREDRRRTDVNEEIIS
jgi:hypothetical protein